MLAIDLQDPKTLIFFGIIIVAMLFLIIALTIFIIKKNSKKRKAKKELDNISKTIIEALGGIDNIISCNVSMSRLNVALKDYKLVEPQQLTDVGISGTVKTSKKLTLVIGKQLSQKLCSSINEQLKKD